MSAEAEKVINLSLCKMAESRGIRRGGSSLHKHLLITSVLTKARSVYFENWYLGDNDCSSVNNGDSMPSHSESSGTTSTDDQIALNQILDPSFFVEVEAEIELPSDILNCVEKLGDMTDMQMGFNVSGGVDLNARIRVEEQMLSEGESDDQVTSSTNDMIQGDSESESFKLRNETGLTYTYLDLDSSKSIPRSLSTVSVMPLPSLFSNISSIQAPTHSTSKRRRGWNFDIEDDSDDEDEEEPCSGSLDLKDKLKMHGTISRGVRHVAKRLRSSISSNSTNSTDVFDSSTTLSTSTRDPSFNFEVSNFRTKKAHFEVDEDEDSTGTVNCNTFIEEEDDDWCAVKVKSSERNDRRVPSASSSCSSDEEQESGSCSMEVDQLTSLVQYFSFQKQQANSAPAGLVTNAKVSQSQLPSLSRSMSSPDLCGRSGGNINSSSSGNSISCPKTKDLFTSYGLTSSHRVLTMKV